MSGNLLDDVERKDQVLSLLSHELRGPLASILMQARLLRSKTLTAQQVQAAAEAIERAARSQLGSIEDLLDMSRIRAEELVVVPVLLDLRSVVEEAVLEVSPHAEESGIRFRVALPAKPVPVSGDRARLGQVTAKLLLNALKFTPVGGLVTVTVTTTEAMVTVSVEDNGIGISQELIGRVFEPFVQGDMTSARRHGGLGIGLAIVKHVVASHGGRVSAESDGIGKGAVVSFSLPIVDGVPTAAAPPVYVGALSLDALKVLIVDDDSDTGAVIAEMLGTLGAKTLVASSAIEGMIAVSAFKPNVLVCDIAMPGEDGYGFIRRLRSLRDPAQRAIPALALTALSGDEDVRRTLAAGFQMHVAKPVDMAVLSASVAKLSGRISAPA